MSGSETYVSAEVPANALDLVGLSEDDFTRQAEALGYTVRIVTLDGESLAGDANYIPTRLNIRIGDGIVTGSTASSDGVGAFYNRLYPVPPS